CDAPTHYCTNYWECCSGYCEHSHCW
uniref:Gamma-conotoxin PiVIIA n=1 Tax=Conus princeps TaxID=101311 RepID=O27A_CONPG|nr:RecName: Full=Gamma-conotoxin PiVIIA [Conus princeps]